VSVKTKKHREILKYFRNISWNISGQNKFMKFFITTPEEACHQVTRFDWVHMTFHRLISCVDRRCFKQWERVLTGKIYFWRLEPVGFSERGGSYKLASSSVCVCSRDTFSCMIFINVTKDSKNQRRRWEWSLGVPIGAKAYSG